MKAGLPNMQSYLKISQYINNQYKPFIKAECIFLTHNDKQHERNIASNRLESEALIWQPNYTGK